MATYERLDYGSDDGSQWGDTAARIAFYGSTPITRQVVGFNLSTATHASTLVSTLFSALVSTGLIASST